MNAHTETSDWDKLLDSENTAPLSPSEIKTLRQIIKDRDRTRWLKGAMKYWAGWMAAIIVGITMSWDGLKKIVQVLKS